jgi:exodeoxyribonuclease X
VRICVLDTETTGLDPAAGDWVCEVAWAVLNTENGAVGHHASRLCFGGDGKIPPVARAVHHIHPAWLIGQPTVAEVLARYDWRDVDYFAAHSAPFDRSFVGSLLPANKPWIDTCRAARHVWPEAPAYGNQVLRYWLGAEPDLTGLGRAELAPHRALYDVCCTAAILKRMLDHVAAVEKWVDPDRAPGHLVWLSDQPVLQRTCGFGKHRGTPWSAVPRDYLQWILRSDIDDPDVIHTARHYLEGRTSLG